MKSNNQVVHANGLFNNSGYGVKHAVQELGQKMTLQGEVISIDQLESARTGNCGLSCSRNNLDSIVGSSTVLSSW